MESIGERLRIARDKKNLRQTQVMERTGINNKTLSGYEKGISAPDYDTLKKLAALYEVSIEWLLGTDAPEATFRKSVQDLSAAQIAEVVREVADRYKVDLSNPVKRKAIEDIVRVGIKVIAQTDETEK